MDNIKSALLGMVNAATLAKKMDKGMVELGYSETPYATLYADISDAIYQMIGEHTDRFEDSVTYTMLTAPYLDNERRAASLAYVYAKNFSQPKPDTMEPDAMKKLHEKNGGYVSPEGDWT